MWFNTTGELRWSARQYDGNSDVGVIVSHCPFCGTKLDSRHTTSAKAEPAKSRELGDVIDAMFGEIPKTESGLRAALVGIKSSNDFAPPEGAKMWWKATVDLLMKEIGEPKSEWQKRVAAIFSGKVV
jgi:hypothetical protein